MSLCGKGATPPEWLIPRKGVTEEDRWSVSRSRCDKDPEALPAERHVLIADYLAPHGRGRRILLPEVDCHLAVAQVLLGFDNERRWIAIPTATTPATDASIGPEAGLVCAGDGMEGSEFTPVG